MKKEEMLQGILQGMLMLAIMNAIGLLVMLAHQTGWASLGVLQYVRPELMRLMTLMFLAFTTIGVAAVWYAWLQLRRLRRTGGWERIS